MELFDSYVIPAQPITLWGRDVLQQMGVSLISNELVSISSNVTYGI